MSLDPYRPWFLAAALYNAGWGSLVVLAPGAVLDVVGVHDHGVLPLWQAVGMMVLVYSPAYWWASRDPWRHRHLVVIGVLGKVLGLAGFLAAAVAGLLPWSFGLVVLLNDIIWLPAFLAFVYGVAKLSGWRRVLSGA